MPYFQNGQMYDDDGNLMGGELAGTPVSTRPPQAPAAPAAPQSPGFAGMPGQMTPAERAYYYANMPDVTGQNATIARQRAQADAMRGNAAPQRGRMDWASQAARGLEGIGGAKAEMDATRARAKLFEDLRRVHSNAPGNQAQSPAPILPGFKDPEDLI